MKKILSLMVLSLWMAGGSSAWALCAMGGACKAGTPTMVITPAAKEKAKKTKKKAASLAKVYVCPMDGTTSDKPGACPKCGMSLVEKK